MKWFFAVNEAALSKKRFLWEPMIRVAIASARRNTSLQPHLIVYGPGEDPFLRVVASEGVRIILHRLTYLDTLAAHYGEGQAFSIASGAFLRTEIPLLEREDEVVLYTDCDVMFQHEPVIALDPGVPFACAPEFERGNYVDINSGVMAMNLPLLRESLPSFTAWIGANLADLCYDQSAYRGYYAGHWGRLPPELNWKPYWGPSDQAPIVHFHGVKPYWAERLMTDPSDMHHPAYNDLYQKSPDGYAHFMRKWRAWTEALDANSGRQ